MSPDALLRQLEQTGIRLGLDGDDLHADVLPGVDLTPYVAMIQERKPALVAALRLQEEIIQAATAATHAFDRRAYDELWRRWYALEREELAL